MPYASASEVPDNVPVKYRPQFMEVWNAVYAVSIANKRSPAQAEEDAFKQAHGAILKTKQKDERDGGQAADPEQTLRFSTEQERGPDGKFGSGSSSSPHEHDAVKSTGAQNEEQHPRVKQALESEHGVANIGQFTKEDQKALDKAVKDGVIEKGKGGGHPIEKTVYAKPGFDFKGDREKQLAELKQIHEEDNKRLERSHRRVQALMLGGVIVT